MGSNKRHKTEKSRDAKKKRHRSRSRSYTPDREKSEKHRHHKKHRRKERKDYDSDGIKSDNSYKSIINIDFIRRIIFFLIFS